MSREPHEVYKVTYDRIVLQGGFYIKPNAKRVQIGKGVKISPDLQIGLPDKPVENFIVGDYSRLYGGKIAPRNFICGDYVTIHDGVWAYGRNDIVIGHNSWFGMRCTLDAEGGFSVGNGFGAGQDTHMWSHIRHGDVVQGNRFLSFGSFIADDDVWLVGRCTSGPAHHGARSMALTESNLTKDMPPDTIWGGNPAKDLTDKIGAPFDVLPIVDKIARFKGRVLEFIKQSGMDANKILEVAETFDVTSRTYIKRHIPEEVALMRFLLPEAKFVPQNNRRISLIEWPL